MKNLLKKELKLAASPLSYIFVSFGLLTFFPGYPILVGGFFVCLGIFQTFQAAREANDILYSALLPVRKADTVKSKYLFCIFIELLAFLVSAGVTLLRMTVLVDAIFYRTNALMNANLIYLGYLLLIYGLFNAVFVGGFFKKAYKFTRPFIGFIVAAFAVVGVAETVIHLPGCGAMNAFGFDHIGLQLSCLGLGLGLFVLLTGCSEKLAERRFEAIDL